MAIGNLEKIEIKKQLETIVDEVFRGFPSDSEGGGKIF